MSHIRVLEGSIKLIEQATAKSSFCLGDGICRPSLERILISRWLSDLRRMKFRWSLRAQLFVVFLVCITTSWILHVRHRHRQLIDTGARISFVWENPTIKSKEFHGIEWVGDLRVSQRWVRHQIATSPSKRTVFAKTMSWLMGDRVRGIAMPRTAITDASIEKLKEMQQLKCVVVNDVDTMDYPEVTLLQKSLPHVVIRPAIEY